ncbi:MAG: hypothetical protein JW768_14825, partial [Chitinispirillaceae bacterium]|nr:hypothetical protein [Chitinispirillaceae bacterium]
MRYLSCLLLGMPLLFLYYLTCSNPANPFDPDKVKINLILVSSSGDTSGSEIADTVGNSIRIGVIISLAQHIDSTIVTFGPSQTSYDTVWTLDKRYKDPVDTVWLDYTLQSTGDRIITATGFAKENHRPWASATVHVINRPSPNQPPVLTVSGNQSIVAGDACLLTASASDPDSGQTVSIQAFDIPASASFDGTTFSWTTTLADTGTHTVTFVAADNGDPVLTDTEHVTITVTPPGVNRPPQFSADTVTLIGTPGTQVSLTLADKCSDPDNDSIAYSLLAGPPTNDTVISTSWSFTPSDSDTGTFHALVRAHDPAGASDTLTIALTVSARDNTPPIMRLLSPATDSATVSSPSYQVKVSCKDASGVASVKCSMGTDTFSVTGSDTTYAATVTGLAANQWNIIMFIGMDASAQANACTLAVHLRYDSTITDNVPPTIRIASPAADTTVGVDSCRISAICTDASGIASVTMTLGSATPVTATRSQ